MHLPIRRSACLRPDCLLSTQKESSSRRGRKATSLRMFAQNTAWKTKTILRRFFFCDSVVCLCFVGTATSVSWWNISFQCCRSRTALPLLWRVPSTAVSPTGRSRSQNWTWTRCCRSQIPDLPLPVYWDRITGLHFIMWCLVAQNDWGANKTHRLCIWHAFWAWFDPIGCKKL